MLIPIPYRFTWLLAAANLAVGTGLAIANFGVGAGREVLLPLSSGCHAALSTRGPSAFRVRILEGAAAPLEAPPVRPDAADAPFSEVSSGRGRGISASFGSLLVSADSRLVLLSASNATLTESAPIDKNFTLSFATNSTRLYGGGSSLEDGMELATNKHVVPTVTNLATYVPYYYSPGDGYAALGVSSQTGAGEPNGGPYKSEASAVMHLMYKAEPDNITWWYRGAFELYLMPASTLEKGTQAYYALTGVPRVLPRYAFGFIASRWGWESRARIESVLRTFREQRYPIDAFIVDFEFFTTFNDYNLGAQGSDRYLDFGFNDITFPEPQKQLSTYEDLAHVRMGAIRKPRLGNNALLKEAREAGFMADATQLRGPGNILQRWLNFSRPEVQAWYAMQIGHYLDAGVDFWWNDEGEADYYTYYWWNFAERGALQMRNKSKRFFSLNRAFTPGMARLGAAVWTGDNAHRWDHLAATPGQMLKWAMAGAPYVACDIGGFNAALVEDPDLLTRWYQVGVFMPIMRVHSVITAKPRFPWLWGARHSQIMRQALEWRYRLVPYHYSLAHAMHAGGRLWTRPLAMAFPDDSNASTISTQWMDGDLLVAPVLQPNSTKEVYLPEGEWYELTGTATTKGPTHLRGQARLEEVPVFVPKGTVLPLAPVVQYTDALPGGALEVQVYGGADGAFELVEDDGMTMAYESGAVRTTRLSWDEGRRTLAWAVNGSAPGPQAFRELFVTLFEPQGIQRSAVRALGEGGSVGFALAAQRNVLNMRRKRRGCGTRHACKQLQAALEKAVSA